MVTRNKYLEYRNQLSEDDVKLFSNRIIRHLCDAIDFFDYENILCFFPANNEVDIRALYRELITSNNNLYFPKTNGKNMTFHKVLDLDRDFIIGNYKIMEPINGDMPDLSKETLVITPGLVFDKNLNRVGYGKGFYDRFFASNPGMIKVGICYDFQIIDNVFPKEHDVPLDYLVSDLMIYRR